jgi:hypothetical protein
MKIGKDTLVFQINITNKTTINTDIKYLEWFQIIAEWCCDFCSLNEASHHSKGKIVSVL